MRSVLSVCAALLVWACPPAGDKGLESQYRRLEKLTSANIVLRKGANGAVSVIHPGGSHEERTRQEREIRDFFVSQGDRGAQFLVGRLESINADEARFLNESDDREGKLRYESYLFDQDKLSLTKYHLCFILADMFPQVSSQSQEAILRAVAASYTPSSYGREDMQFLHYALLRAGRESVPYFLELATRRSEHVRCGVASVLDSIAEEALAGAASSAKPPRLEPPCRAAEEERGKALAAWKQWWEQEGHKGPFSKLPSFYDLSTESPDKDEPKRTAGPPPK